ncbi:hypothetical protein [Actibacterium sp. MT2.3-13A]|uniref:hypothetical protein n=1 Tax=Actibacterium sp. MT2.3-13A TaxID=2828332 RepID=UPI001BAB6410|nr:hypothetical protein [Actibacterium sp. MT2.3-13A]
MGPQARPGPPFCFQPMRAAPGLTTIGELEPPEMLEVPRAIVPDSRTAGWFVKGAIPGR